MTELFNGKTNNGVVGASYTPTSPGTYKVTINHAQSISFKAVEAVRYIYVDKLTTTLSASNVSGLVNDRMTITATLKYGSTPLSGKTISFYNGSTLFSSTTTDSNGVATIYDTPTTVRTNTLTARFDGDDTYQTSSTSFTTTTTKRDLRFKTAPSVVCELGDVATLTSTVVDTLTGAGVSGLPVHYEWTFEKVRDRDCTTDSTGTATGSWTTLLPGSAIVTVTCGGNELYNRVTHELRLTVNKHPTAIEATSSMSCTVGVPVDLSCTLRRTTGSLVPLGGKTITVKSGSGVLGTCATNNYGVGTLTWTAKSTGTSTITFVYDGEEYYDNCSTNTILTKNSNS